MHGSGQVCGALERLSKLSGLSDADLTLDLNLASAADYERAWLFITERLLAARWLPAAGPIAMDAGNAAPSA